MELDGTRAWYLILLSLVFAVRESAAAQFGNSAILQVAAGTPGCLLGANVSSVRRFIFGKLLQML